MKKSIPSSKSWLVVNAVNSSSDGLTFIISAFSISFVSSSPSNKYKFSIIIMPSVVIEPDNLRKLSSGALGSQSLLQRMWYSLSSIYHIK